MMINTIVAKSDRCIAVSASAFIFIFLLSVSAMSRADTTLDWEVPKYDYSLDGTIHVGVRYDATPFSYKKPTKAEEDILAGYGGYIVEVCRSILRQVIKSGPLDRYHVKAVEVTASNRFDKLLAGEVDMLCGPDSITTSRLHKYNVSHPIFLSGVAVAKVPLEKLPQTKHCGPVVGVVKGTTSQFAGLKSAADAGAFDVRFNAPVRQYLQLASGSRPDLDVQHLGKLWQKFSSDLVSDDNDDDNGYTFNGDNGWSNPSDIKTPQDCDTGYKSGPVILYDNHDVGLSDLCSGNIFFYLGDVDIIKRKKPENCNITISRQTYTKEAYGIYFRKFNTYVGDTAPEVDIYDAVLYSEFNNTLLTQMQDSENVLLNHYFSEFGDSRMAVDLETFFKSFQYATNY